MVTWVACTVSSGSEEEGIHHSVIVLIPVSRCMSQGTTTKRVATNRGIFMVGHITLIKTRKKSAYLIWPYQGVVFYKDTL